MSIPTRGLVNAEQSAKDEPRLFSPGNVLPFVLVTALFLFWGIPSNMNDILIKQFMKSFEITRFKAGLIQSSYYMGYFLLSMPAALIMRRVQLQDRAGDWTVALQCRNVSLLAGGDRSPIWVLPLCTFSLSPAGRRSWKPERTRSSRFWAIRGLRSGG